MAKNLFINACARENSRTLALAKHLADKLCGDVERIDLYKLDLLPLDNEGIIKRQAAAFKNNFDDECFNFAKQFAGADIIIVAAPYWDLLFPAVLKTYLESISVSGITFDYSDSGRPVGLCCAKALYYVTTAGGYIGDKNFGFEYIKSLSQTLFGINNVKYFCAEGLDIDPQRAKIILENAIKEVDDYEI